MANKKEEAKQAYLLQDTIYHILEWLKRLWIFILIFAVLGASGYVFFTYKTYTPTYSASATFTVNVDVSTSSAESYNKATAQQLAKTFPNILTSSSLNKIICHDLGVGYINENISASALEDTNLFTITVNSSESPQKAYDVLSSVINNYPQVAKFIIGSTQLVLIDTSTVTTKPTNMPNYTRNIFIGAGIGALLAMAIIVLLGMVTSTVIRADDLMTYFNTSCIASVPELSVKRRSKKKENSIPNISNKNVNYKFRESLFSARNIIVRKCNEKGYKTIVVTSTISGEGKSVIALNLAQSLALKGYKTCLVDFDLRVPSIAGYMQIENEINSVSNYINGDVDVNSCVYATESPNFYIAVEMNNNANASELVGSENAKKLINKLKNIFEFVIIDSPPSGYLSDASVIGDYSDAVVYVVAQDVVSRRNIMDGLSSFDATNASVIGCILNRISKGTESLSYGKYGYRRYGYSRYGYGRNSGKYGKYGKYDSTERHAIREDVDYSKITSNGIEFKDDSE